MIELLAPAKDKICAKAAIDFGADAIYIGAREFGARKNVPNSIADIKEIIEYAHKFDVKVYAAINTILNDEEILRAKNLMRELAKINIDAVIIQDMGLIEIAKELNLPIHASTQCDIRDSEKVNFLENSGFERVILARELSIEQIKEIKKQTNVELETFIHGALCVSYSGQCYLSYAIGGRSANRGECAQPCRKKYSLQDEAGNVIAKNKHLLCLKDFNASKQLKEIANAGVTSFKIEGRLKDVNYVKNVVAYYRKLIDELGIEKTSSGEILFDFEPNLEKSFNRGFTDYFLSGKRSEICSFESPKAKGEYLGKVSKISKDYLEINSKIHPQDGLCYLKDGELQGFLVNKVDKNRIYPNKMPEIKVGTKIYRNYDSEFEKQLKNSKTCRKVGINITFSLNKISAIDEDKNSAEIEYSFDEFAQNQEKMGANVINQLKKSGESIFLVKEVKIDADKLPFLQVSKLNELRRELLEKLQNTKSKMQKRSSGISARLHETKKPVSSEVNYCANVLNTSAKEFYAKQGIKIIEPAFESGLSKAGKTVMTCKHCLKHSFNLCKSPKNLFLVDEKDKKYELKFDCANCEMKIVF